MTHYIQYGLVMLKVIHTRLLLIYTANLCDYVTDDRQSNVNGGRSYVELQWSNAQKQSFLNTAKKVGSESINYYIILYIYKQF